MPTPDVPGDCPNAVGVHTGEVATCSGVLLPTSLAADLHNQAVWADALSATYDLDVPALIAERDAARAEAADLRKRPSPALCRGEGVALGAGGVAVVVFLGVEIAHSLAVVK